MLSAIRRNTIPLIVATALFMENLDAMVLSTALPVVAKDLAVSPIHLKLAVTSYLLALAIFIPASGWVADRYGARTVFRAAMVVFALGSIGCGLSQGLGSLVAARVVQGIGGAMMVPVGRLVLLRSVPKSELVGAVAWLTIPALLGPVLGPPLGGFVATYFDWRWIFWINVPVALAGIALITRFIPEVRGDGTAPFDLRGFMLVGPGLAMFLTGGTLAGLGLIEAFYVVVLIGAGAALLALYIAHALNVPAPIIDLKLLKLPTFRASVSGGLLFRIGIGALPFLLPLMFQLGFGLTPFQTGMMTFATGLGAIFMKTQALRILNAYGYRRVLIVNAVISSAFLAMPAAFTIATPALLITVLLLASGLSRALQFTAINTLAYADVPPEQLSRATSFTAALQQLGGSIGVSLAALGLELMQHMRGTTAIDADLFAPVFVALAMLTGYAAVIFARLPSNAGGSLLTAGAKPIEKESAPVLPAARLTRLPLPAMRGEDQPNR